jgi:hypothetical protein
MSFQFSTQIFWLQFFLLPISTLPENGTSTEIERGREVVLSYSLGGAAIALLLLVSAYLWKKKEKTTKSAPSREYLHEKEIAKTPPKLSTNLETVIRTGPSLESPAPVSPTEDIFTTRFSTKTGRTHVAKTKEIAIPGYLLISQNDYQLVKVIAEGGYGKICMASILSEELKSRNGGLNMCAVKILESIFLLFNIRK